MANAWGKKTHTSLTLMHVLEEKPWNPVEELAVCKVGKGEEKVGER